MNNASTRLKLQDLLYGMTHLQHPTFPVWTRVGGIESSNL